MIKKERISSLAMDILLINCFKFSFKKMHRDDFSIMMMNTISRLTKV